MTIAVIQSRAAHAVVYKLVPVIADIVSAHCWGTRAGEEYVRACVHAHWDQAAEMTMGGGFQGPRLREFPELLQME